MTFRLFNTLSREKEEFVPLHSGEVSIYSCGPTVYAPAHIGNLRAFLFADTLQRWLRFGLGYKEKVKWVMNITDVDDKTIRDSRAAFPNLDPKEALLKHTRGYEELFFADLETLGIKREHFTANPRATEYIPQQQALVQKIYDNGFAYISDGSVYFDVEKYRKAHQYGRLVKLDFEKMEGHSRIDTDEYEKASAHDFVLWKGKKDDEPFWDFELKTSSSPNPAVHGGVELKLVETEEEWAFIHQLREKEIFEKYHPDKTYWRENPDDREQKNSLVLLTDGKNFLGTTRIDDIGNDTFSFRMLAVDPKFQGKGYGKTLLHLAEHWATRRGAKKLYVNSEKETKEFYGKFGFIERKDGEKMGFEVIPMTKDLEIQTISLPGRPGWHLECSAMEEAIFGPRFDIHTGGIDLCFPHHEDEIAQSVAANGIDPVNYWCHNEFLLVDGKKMSKSLGNFYTLKDLLKIHLDGEEHTVSADAIRFFFVTQHYRTETNLRNEALKGACSVVKNIRLIATRHHLQAIKDTVLTSKWHQDFIDAMNKDLNTSEAFVVISEAIQALDKGNAVPVEIKSLLEFASNIFGIDFLAYPWIANFPIPEPINEAMTQFLIARKNRNQEMDIENYKKMLHLGFARKEQLWGWEIVKMPPYKVQQLADTRLSARQAKNWAESDRLRDEIAKFGWKVEDTKDGFHLTSL